MADMCGPSNALSNFQKHTTIDRTLQQDRLIARQPPSQGFRSAGPNARHLDPEFEAFQSGKFPLDQSFQQAPAPFSRPQAVPGPSNWAADFQRLNITSPSPQIQSRNDIAAGWHQDFGRQQAHFAGPSSAQAQAQQQNSFVPQYAPMGIGMGITQYSGYQNPHETYQQQQQSVEQFDEAAFEKAFEAAASAELNSVETTEPTLAQQADIEVEQSVNRSESQDLETQHTTGLLDETLMEPQTLEEVLRSSSPQPNDGPLNQPFIGSDTIIDPSKPASEQVGNDDPDALARTAQNLIDRLSGDTRQKMQESEFMKLMRGFASGQKGIVGENVVEKNTPREPAENSLGEARAV